MAPRRKDAKTSPERVAELLLARIDRELVSCRDLQTLWAGYGHICAIIAVPSGASTSKPTRGNEERYILKYISPPPADKDEGHLRKMLSYDVEAWFYDHVAPDLPQNVKVAKAFASSSGVGAGGELEGITALLLEDLRVAYPVAGGKREFLDKPQVYAGIDWLARFHASSWRYAPFNLDTHVLPPLDETRRRAKDPNRARRTTLWLNGGYTYLATRQSELADLADDRGSEWSSVFCRPHGSKSKSKPNGKSDPSQDQTVAELAAAALTPRGRPEESYIHGDVKSENLFSTSAGDAVAFFDFQYVGIGLGVCDLAKLFTCSVPLGMLTGHRGKLPRSLGMEDGERALLERYLSTLLEGTGRTYAWDLLVRHWETALVDWCRFQASWGFWGNTTWLEARVRSVLADDGWWKWVRRDTEVE